MKKNATRDISYASSAQSVAGRAVIRSIENITGRIGLIKRAADYELEVASSARSFWEVMVDRYHLQQIFCRENLPIFRNMDPS